MSLLVARLTTGTVASPGFGQATWAGLAPTIVTPNTVPIGLGQATWAGLAPTITVAVTVTPGLGQATWAGLAPTVITPNTVPIGLGQATWTGLAPSIQISIVVAPGLGQATWAGLAPTIVTTANQVVTPGVGAGIWQGIAPTLPGFGTAAVGGRRPRARAELPPRKVRVKAHPRYFELAEDALAEPGTAKLRIRASAPRVTVTNVDAEDRLVLRLVVDDEDMLLALAAADAWMN